ncbi:MAG: class I SAM-dependent methyltransferase, partial [Pseudomonadota bacterium]|nr:class I SAM-dependent methyltransferase [Pseudomonadota bacterium]
MTRAFLRPDMAVLEFGCGTGSTAIAHAPFVKHIQAIDVSSKMIEIAQRKAAENAIENVTFRHAAIDQVDIPDSSLDAVLGLNVLHVLTNWQEIPAHVHRMLKPGGVFVSSTMCLGDS